MSKDDSAIEEVGELVEALRQRRISRTTFCRALVGIPPKVVREAFAKLIEETSDGE